MIRIISTVGAEESGITLLVRTLLAEVKHLLVSVLSEKKMNYTVTITGV